MTVASVRQALDSGALLVDTRPLDAYTSAHIPGALPIEFNLADLADRAALLLPTGLAVVVHAEPASTVPAAVGLLTDAGLAVAGHLEGGLAAWRAAGLPTSHLETITPEHLAAAPEAYHILDVREPFEYRHGHLAAALPLPSGEAFAAVASGNWTTPADGKPYAVFCSGWGRAAFVAGLLRAREIPAVLVAGGMYRWQAEGRPLISASR